MPEAETLELDSVMDQVAAGMDTSGLQDAGEDGADEGADAPIDTGSPAADAGASTETDEDLSVPQSWKKEMHPIWDKLAKGVPLDAKESRQAAKYYREREQQMLTGLEGYKGDAGYGRTMREAFKPFADVLKSQGVDEVKALTFLLNAHKGLSDPRTAKDWYGRIAKSYGIEAANAMAASDDTPPAVQAALERIQRVEGFLTEQQQREQEQRVEATRKEVDAFASDPKHPYFDECSEDIAKLIGAGYSLQDAYEKAVWANPVTRQKELGRMQKEQAEAAKKKALEAAKQARKGTAVNVKGRDTARASTEPAGSMDDTLRETLADIKTRT